MSEKSSAADWSLAKGSVLVALSVWILCAIWIGTQMQVLPTVHAAPGSGPLDLMARTALILLSLVLLLLFGWTMGRYSGATGHEDQAGR